MWGLSNAGTKAGTGSQYRRGSVDLTLAGWRDNGPRRSYIGAPYTAVISVSFLVDYSTL